MASGSVAELSSGGPVRYRLTLGGDAGWVRDQGGVHVHDVAGSTALVEFADDEARRTLLRSAVDRGDVLDFARHTPALSEIYREVTS